MLVGSLGMDHLFRIYKDALHSEVCKGMIEKFENHPEQYEQCHEGAMHFSQNKKIATSNT